MASEMKLLLIKGQGGYDITELVSEVRWKGRKGSSSRTLEVTLLDDGDNKRERSGIDVEQGHQCMFFYEDEELFRGIITDTDQGNDRTLKFIAFDNGIYLAKNDDTFSYENITADAVFTDVCSRFGLPTGSVSGCSYVIPELIKSKTSAWDAIADALSLDYDATKVRHYISSEKGLLNLRTRTENVIQWVLETGVNISSYSLRKSIQNIKTRIKMVSSEDTVVAERANAALESKIGIFQAIEKPDETLTEAQLNDLVGSLLANISTPEQTLNLTTLGKKEVISGVGVSVIIPELDIKKSFYVDEDIHTFKGSAYAMQLTLNTTGDF